MATIEELVKQYDKDPALKKEVVDILADNKITLSEFTGFVKKHEVEVSIKDFPKIIKEAKEAGLIK
jgi:hypothetical protein